MPHVFVPFIIQIAVRFSVVIIVRHARSQMLVYCRYAFQHDQTSAMRLRVSATSPLASPDIMPACLHLRVSCLFSCFVFPASVSIRPKVKYNKGANVDDVLYAKTEGVTTHHTSSCGVMLRRRFCVFSACMYVRDSFLGIASCLFGFYCTLPVV